MNAESAYRSPGVARRRVAVLTVVHTPNDIRIFHRQARSLACAGYDVTLLAPHSGDEWSEGITIKALPRPRGRLERMTRTVWQAYRLALREDADVYHFHDPELIPVAILLKMHGKCVIYDVHEDLPRDIVDKDWIPARLRSLIARLAEAVEWAAGKAWDGIVAATPHIALRFPPAKTITVQNFPHSNELMATGMDFQQRSLTACYVGGLTPGRGALEMVEALALLPRGLGVRLLLAGTISPPELERELRRRPGWKQVDFVGWQSREGIRRVMAKSRVGLVLFHPLANNVDAQPNKLFEYLAAGLPIVASDFPLWKELIHGLNCGLVVDPLNPRSIADRILWLFEHSNEAEAMGKRGLQAVVTKYSWEREAEKLLKFYSCLFRDKRNGKQPVRRRVASRT